FGKSGPRRRDARLSVVRGGRPLPDLPQAAHPDRRWFHLAPRISPSMRERLKGRDAKARLVPAPALPPLAARLPDFLGAQAVPAGALAGLHLAFIGAGSVGLQLIQHCARLTPARMTIIDPKTIKPASLLTHPIHSKAALGRAKSQYAAQW